MRLVKLWVGLALSLVAGLAFADSASATAQVINKVFDTTTGLASASPYLEDGKRLYAILLSIAVSWAGIKVVIDEGGINAALASLMKTIIVSGLAGFFMLGSTQSSFVRGFDYLAQKAVVATGAGINLENPAKAMIQVAGRAMQQVDLLWNGAENLKNEEAGKLPWLQTLAGDSLLGQVLDGAGSVLTKIGISILLMLTLCIFLLQYLLSQMLVLIGLIFAPIFIPFLVLDSTSFLFHGWLKFMIVSGVQKMVGALLFGLSLQLIDALPAITAEAAEHRALMLFPYLACLLLVLFMASLLWKTQEIAAGLVSGMPSAGMTPPRLKSPGGGGAGKGGTPPAPGTPPGAPPVRPPADPNRFNPGASK